MKTVHAKPSQVPRYVSFGSRAAFESIEFTSRTVLTVESNSRAKRIGILFKRPARSPPPVILSPYRSNLRRLLPFFVSPLFPCRTPNSLSVAHDKAPRTRPSESFVVTSVISTDYFNLDSRFFHRSHLRISSVRIALLADKLLKLNKG